MSDFEEPAEEQALLERITASHRHQIESADELEAPKSSGSPKLPMPSLEDVFARGIDKKIDSEREHPNIHFDELTRSRILEGEAERISKVLDSIELRSIGSMDQRLLTNIGSSVLARDTYLDSYSYSAKALQASQVNIA